MQRETGMVRAADKSTQGLVRHFKWIALCMLMASMLSLSRSVLAVNGDRPVVLQVYLAEQARKPVVRRQLEERFQRPFQQITEEQYAAFMKGLNLDRDEDLFQWSHVTDIPVLALRKTSSFFRMNLHLMEDRDAAEQLSRLTSFKYQTFYDEKTGKIDLQDESGTSLKLRAIPDNLLMPVDRIGRYWHFRNFVDSQINYRVIEPYLIRFGDLPYRNALGEWIRKIPLSIVKVYSGKAIYFTNLQGRSFSTTMPVSNETYKLHTGLKTGVWIEMRNDGNAGSEKNFIHELGHLIDRVVLNGGYDSYRDNDQFPEFRKLMADKQKIFGVMDDKVLNTPFGYISNYAKTNAQESFAEHFRAFIGEKEHFRAKAEKEAAEGHPELMRKYQFMKKMMEETSTRKVRLSKAFLEEEERENQSDR